MKSCGETPRAQPTDLQADGNRDGRVDEADYELWKANFGQTATAGK